MAAKKKVAEQVEVLNEVVVEPVNEVDPAFIGQTHSLCGGTGLLDKFTLCTVCNGTGKLN